MPAKQSIKDNYWRSIQPTVVSSVELEVARESVTPYTAVSVETN